MYVKEGLTTSSVVRESNVNNMVSKLAYTEITLVAEVAKYFPDFPILISSLITIRHSG